MDIVVIETYCTVINFNNDNKKEVQKVFSLFIITFIAEFIFKIISENSLKKICSLIG